MARHSTLSTGITLSYLDRALNQLSTAMYERALESHRVQAARLVGANRLRAIVADLEQLVRRERRADIESRCADASTRAA